MWCNFAHQLCVQGGCDFTNEVAVLGLLATLCGAQSSENDWLAEPKGLKSRRPAHFIRITAVLSAIAPKQSATKVYQSLNRH